MDLTVWLSISFVLVLVMLLVICRIYWRKASSFDEMSNETNSSGMTKNQPLPENFDTFSVGTFKSTSQDIQRTTSHATADLKTKLKLILNQVQPVMFQICFISALTLDFPEEVQSIDQWDSISCMQ